MNPPPHADDFRAQLTCRAHDGDMRLFAANLRSPHGPYSDHMLRFASDARRSRRRLRRRARQAHLCTDPHERKRLLELLDAIAELYGFTSVEALVEHDDELAAERELHTIDSDASVPLLVDALRDSIARHAPPAPTFHVSSPEGRAA